MLGVAVLIWLRWCGCAGVSVGEGVCRGEEEEGCGLLVPVLLATTTDLYTMPCYDLV